jgi:ERF superfamily
MINSSEQLDKLAEALTAFQSKFKNPPKNKTNPYFNSTYVDLADGLDLIRKALAEEGLSFIQLTSAGEDRVILHTRLLHVTGQWIEGTYPVSKLAKAQEMGSALTYARRYTLFALVGVAGEDDDDGNRATHGEQKPSNNSIVQKAMAKVTPKPDADAIAQSEKLANTLIHEITNIYKKDLLSKWNAANEERKAKLLPDHRTQVKEAFFAHLGTLG